MENLRIWLRESNALSKNDRAVIESIASVESVKTLTGQRAGIWGETSEQTQRWHVTYRNGRQGVLETSCWGNLDGCGLTITRQE